MGQGKLDITNESLIKAVGAFGGGVASTGGTCGALLGGVALISSLYARGNLNEKDDPRMWRMSYKFAKRFENIAEKYGGTNCREIARVNWSDKEAAFEFHANPGSRRMICAELVGELAYALGEIIEKHSKLKKEPH